MTKSNPPQRGPIHHHGPRPGGDYAKVSNEFLRARELSPTAHRVVAFLLSHADGYPVSVAVIREGTGLSRATVLRALQAAVSARWLVMQDVWREGGKDRSFRRYITTSYRLSEQEVAALSVRETRQPGTGAGAPRTGGIDPDSVSPSPTGPVSKLDRYQNETGIKTAPVPVSKRDHVEDHVEDQSLLTSVSPSALVDAETREGAHGAGCERPSMSVTELATGKPDRRPEPAPAEIQRAVAAAPAADLVREVIPANRYPAAVLTDLRRHVSTMLADGIDEGLVKATLRVWDGRDGGPGLLPHLLADAVKAMNPRPADQQPPGSRKVAKGFAIANRLWPEGSPSKVDRKVAGWLALGADTESPGSTSSVESADPNVLDAEVIEDER